MNAETPTEEEKHILVEGTVLFAQQNGEEISPCVVGAMYDVLFKVCEIVGRQLTHAEIGSLTELLCELAAAASKDRE